MGYVPFDVSDSQPSRHQSHAPAEVDVGPQSIQAWDYSGSTIGGFDDTEIDQRTYGGYVKLLTDQGYAYYCHVQTEQSVWDEPPEYTLAYMAAVKQYEQQRWASPRPSPANRRRSRHQQHPSHPQHSHHASSPSISLGPTVAVTGPRSSSGHPESPASGLTSSSSLRHGGGGKSPSPLPTLPPAPPTKQASAGAGSSSAASAASHSLKAPKASSSSVPTGRLSSRRRGDNALYTLDVEDGPLASEEVAQLRELEGRMSQAPTSAECSRAVHDFFDLRDSMTRRKQAFVLHHFLLPVLLSEQQKDLLVPAVKELPGGWQRRLLSSLMYSQESDRLPGKDDERTLFIETLQVFLVVHLWIVNWERADAATVDKLLRESLSEAADVLLTLDAELAAKTCRLLMQSLITRLSQAARSFQTKLDWSKVLACIKLAEEVLIFGPTLQKDATHLALGCPPIGARTPLATRNHARSDAQLCEYLLALVRLLVGHSSAPSASSAGMAYGGLGTGGGAGRPAPIERRHIKKHVRRELEKTLTFLECTSKLLLEFKTPGVQSPAAAKAASNRTMSAAERRLHERTLERKRNASRRQSSSARSATDAASGGGAAGGFDDDRSDTSASVSGSADTKRSNSLHPGSAAAAGSSTPGHGGAHSAPGSDGAPSENESQRSSKSTSLSINTNLSSRSTSLEPNTVSLVEQFCRELAGRHFAWRMTGHATDISKLETKIIRILEQMRSPVFFGMSDADQAAAAAGSPKNAPQQQHGGGDPLRPSSPALEADPSQPKPPDKPPEELELHRAIVDASEKQKQASLDGDLEAAAHWFATSQDLTRELRELSTQRAAVREARDYIGEATSELPALSALLDRTREDIKEAFEMRELTVLPDFIPELQRQRSKLDDYIRALHLISTDRSQFYARAKDLRDLAASTHDDFLTPFEECGELLAQLAHFVESFYNLYAFLQPPAIPGSPMSSPQGSIQGLSARSTPRQQRPSSAAGGGDDSSHRSSPGV